MKNISLLIQAQFNKMCETGRLFRSSITGQQLWDTYLSTFLSENNPIFRDPESSVHNCNHCKNFIRRYGNILSINNDGKLESIFSNLPIDKLGEYKDSITACNKLLVESRIKDVFFETYEELNKLPYEKCSKSNTVFRLGISQNFKQYSSEEVAKFGVVIESKIYEFNHFHLDIPKKFIDMSGKSIEQITALYRDKYSVFKRAMEEIPLDTLNLVKDLINQGSLLDGTTHLHVIERIIDEKYQYDGCTEDNYLWLRSYDLDERTAKFRNTLIGVLCVELAEGMELNKACENWNKRVDPINYHKATAPITKAQIRAAESFISENGYEDSFNRRLATIDDIKASEILHLNTGKDEIANVSIFDKVKPTKSTQHKRAEFDNVEEVTIEKFMKDILPTTTSIEVLLTNKMESNLCCITTSINKDCKPIFKWDNNYSKTFKGNLAGKSMIKEAVKSLGGNTEAVLRATISWNEDGRSIVDFDIHAIEPKGNHICYSTYKKPNFSPASGQLDIDMINPARLGIENITWINKSKMPEGIYTIYINNFNGRSNSGFKAEIEFDNVIYSYEYTGNAKGSIDIAQITLKNGEFTINHSMPCINDKHVIKTVWNLETNNFHRVNLVCLSPNHWGDVKVGNLYYMFMLDKCKSDEPIRGFHNEDLIPELLKQKGVMEVLGANSLIEPTSNHLAGLGFNSTVRDELIVKVQGSHKRMLKIKF